MHFITTERHLRFLGLVPRKIKPVPDASTKQSPALTPCMETPSQPAPLLNPGDFFFPCCGLIKHRVCLSNFSEALGCWHLASHMAQLGAGFPSRGPVQASEGPHPWVPAPRESGATEGQGCSALSMGTQEASYRTNT